MGSRDHACDVRETVFAEENLEMWVQSAARPNGPGRGASEFLSWPQQS